MNQSETVDAASPSSKRPCPVCGMQNAERLHFQAFVLVEGHPMEAGYWVVICNECGMAYADTATTQKQMDQFYELQSKYSDAKTSTGAGDSPADKIRLDGLADRLSAALPDRSAKIVDIGCAGGGLLRALKRLGYQNLIGIDPAPACVAMTTEPGIVGIIGTLNALPPQVVDIDCAFFSHVFEHVLDTHAALDKLRPHMEPGGSVMVEVPDASSYARHLIAPFQEFNTEHVNHFSSRSLANMLARHGYQTLAEYALELPGGAAPYPVIGGLYQLTPQPLPIVPDRELAERLRGYIAASAKMMAAIDARLRQKLHNATGVIVWGTGQLAMKLLKQTSLGEMNIVAFVDGSPINWGKKLRNIPIISPADAKALTETIVITTTLHQDAITANIREKLGMQNPLVVLRDLTQRQ